jgi:hypothetical protein
MMPNDIRNRIISHLSLIAGLALDIGLTWLYWPMLSKLFINLAENENYSYGLLLPLVGGLQPVAPYPGFPGPGTDLLLLLPAAPL